MHPSHGRGRQSPLARRPRQRQLQPDRRAFPLHRPDAALESIGHRRAGIFPAFARRLRHRRLLRPDATGRSAAATGQSIIQILPVNDTTKAYDAGDAYPYNAISTFALNPVYLRPEAMGSLNDAEATAEMRRRAATLNALPAADYAGALRLKLDYARRLYEMEGKPPAPQPNTATS